MAGLVCCKSCLLKHGLKAMAGEQGQNVRIAMLQTTSSATKISSGGTGVAGSGNSLVVVVRACDLRQH
jgi:hypothetical protein